MNIPAKQQFRGEKLIMQQESQSLQNLLKRRPLMKYKMPHLQKLFASGEKGAEYTPHVPKIK